MISKTLGHAARVAAQFALAAGAALSCLSAAHAAGAYPSRPVVIVAGFPPGGAADLIARLLAQKLSVKEKQRFYVENRPGAGSTIGAAYVAHAKPDGYTLLMGVTASQTIAPFIYPHLPYDADKSFAPIAMVATIPVVLVVNPNVPARTAPELVALARKAQPPLAFGSSGVGAIPHLTGVLFEQSQRVKMLHVPFQGASPALTDLLADRVQLMFDNLPSELPSIQAGTVRALAIAGAHRAQALPNVPTLDEQGIHGVDVSSWFGLMAPAGTPPAVINRLHADLVAIFEDPDFQKSLANMGGEPALSTPQAFEHIIKSDTVLWGKAVKSAGLTPE